VDLKGKLPADGAAIDNASDYRSLAGALQYLTITRPDLAFAVQQACLHMHDPRATHDNAEADLALRQWYEVPRSSSQRHC
jgi:hypothetical protein